MNKFAVVGISGLTISVVCLAAAAAIGGKALSNLGWSGNGMGLGEGADCARGGSDQATSRSMPWTGGDEIAIAIPAKVQYRAGSGDAVIVTGDAALLPHIRISDSTLKLDCRWHGGHHALEVTLPGRTFRAFKIAGAGELTLASINQPDLKLEIEGAGEIKADGKTDRLKLEMAGAGDAKLGELTAREVRVEMAGANEAVIAPQDDLHVHIAGMGEVKLVTEPKHIESDIAGAGHIRHPNDLDSD